MTKNKRWRMPKWIRHLLRSFARLFGFGKHQRRQKDPEILNSERVGAISADQGSSNRLDLNESSKVSASKNFEVGTAEKDLAPHVILSSQQTIGEMNNSIAIGSISDVAGDVYVAVRPYAAGNPFQAPPLQSHYVDRATIRNEIKTLLLGETTAVKGTLVISSISGLGGLGKTVLAAALAHESAVQERFPDGVLWVTLGQQPKDLMLSHLGNWIQALKDYDYKPTTIEAASGHLRTLLYEKKVLLVVDDAWAEEDVKPFLAGGAGCRVLITTREIRITGATQFSLDVMNAKESLELIRNCAGERWKAQDEADALEFAKNVGYLPLAMELAAVQVQEGVTWQTLLGEFRQEVVRLEFLDKAEARKYSTDEKRRDYSLQACFNLSLRRLDTEMLGQFTWLGVLPEDVNIDERVTSTLWQVNTSESRQVLRLLKGKALLLAGVSEKDDLLTYRIHDLIHDTARALIVKPRNCLSDETIQGLGMTLPEAHRSFLDRYKKQIPTGQWSQLPSDGYVHQYLTWHFIRAGKAGDVHLLMMEMDKWGRNAWYEACDRLGKSTFFLQDVARGWAIAEELYEADPTQSIVLQCRYALMTATMNSLAGQLPATMMAAFIKGGFWTIEQAWAYVRQIKVEYKISEAIQALAPYLVTSPILSLALDSIHSMQDEAYRAKALTALAQIDKAYFSEALNTARLIQNTLIRSNVLSTLAQIDKTYFSEALEVIESLTEDVTSQVMALNTLAQVDGADFTQLWEAARSIKSELGWARVLNALAQVDGADFTKLLEAARLMQYEESKAWALTALVHFDRTYFTKALEAAQSIDEIEKEMVLSALAQVDGADFTQLLEATQSIQDELNRADVLITLTKVDGANFTQLLECARSIQYLPWRAKVLTALAQINSVNFTEALAAIRSVNDNDYRAKLLGELAQMDEIDFSQMWNATSSIQDEYDQTRALITLTKIDRNYFSEALETVQLIQNEAYRVSALRAFAQVDRAYLPDLLTAARLIQSNIHRANVLIDLAQIDRAYFTEAFETAQSIQDDFDRASALLLLVRFENANFLSLFEMTQLIQDEFLRATLFSDLTQIDGADLIQLVKAARSIQYAFSRAEALIACTKIDRTYFDEALYTARSIHNQSSRVTILSTLIQIHRIYLSEEMVAAQLIQDEHIRTTVISDLVLKAQVDKTYFSEALAVAQSIQDKYSRTMALRDLILNVQIDRTYFSEALETAQLIQDENSKRRLVYDIVVKYWTQIGVVNFAEALDELRLTQLEDLQAMGLSALAQINGADFTHLLEAMQLIQDESQRASVLVDLAEKIPEELLPKVLMNINAISQPSTYASVLSAYLPRLTSPSQQDWSCVLHYLAQNTRSTFMPKLATLHPAILHLGGATALRGVVDAMREVCGQWK
jgi:hypothetical protein